MSEGKAKLIVRFALTLVLTAAVWSIGWSTPALAYHLNDHKRIALESVAEINHCYPGLIGPAQTYILWAADLDEDTNVFRKDILYSHYFNPFKHLKMFRYDSSVRVSRLENDLREDAMAGNFGDLIVYAHLGHAIHHLEDATVPAHVVPVRHWIRDGFEVFSFTGDISSGLTCDDLKNAAADGDMNSLLVWVAKKTLARIAAFQVKILQNGVPASVTGIAFWQQSTNNDFGHYGVLGNNFGQASFSENGVQYSVPNAQVIFSEFKQQQMKLAVRASVLALNWYLVGHGATPAVDSTVTSN